MRILFLCAALLVHGIAVAQTTDRQRVDLDYDYLELRFVDVDDNGGDGFRFNGSYELENNWLIVGGLTALDFNSNVDQTVIEVGAGYVWRYSRDFDIVSSLRFVRADVDDPGADGHALLGDDRGLTVCMSLPLRRGGRT